MRSPGSFPASRARVTLLLPFPAASRGGMILNLRYNCFYLLSCFISITSGTTPAVVVVGGWAAPSLSPFPDPMAFTQYLNSYQRVSAITLSARLRGERAGPASKAREGEVGDGARSGIPHLTRPLRPQGRRGKIRAVLTQIREYRSPAPGYTRDGLRR